MKTLRTELLVILIAISSTTVFAQEEDQIFYFSAISTHVNEEANFSFNHFLGEEIGKKMYLLESIYTHREESNQLISSSSSPTKHVDKPAIYRSVQKLEKYYKKGVKSGFMSTDQATREFGRILDIALYIRNQQTEQFERVLDDLKEENQIASLYTNNVELSY